jgi:hypothetical protein
MAALLVCIESKLAHLKWGRAGYTGSASLLRRFLTDLRTQQQAASDTAALAPDGSQTLGTVPPELPPAPPVMRRMSPTRASWLYVSQPVKLDEKQRRKVDHIRQGHADLETAYQRETKDLFPCSQSVETRTWMPGFSKPNRVALPS